MFDFVFIKMPTLKYNKGNVSLLSQNILYR